MAAQRQHDVEPHTMRHLGVLALGAFATLCAFIALRQWTVLVRLPEGPRDAVPLFAVSSGPITAFVIVVATAALLAEAVLVSRHVVFRWLALAAGLGAVVAWVAAYASQLAQVESALVAARPWIGRCSPAALYCPSYRIGDGAIYARGALAVAVATVLLAVFGWGAATLGGAVVASIQGMAPHIVGHEVTATDVRGVWFWSDTMMVASLFLVVLLGWWALGLAMGPKWWWLVVAMVIWAVLFFVMVTLGSDRPEQEQVLTAVQGLGVLGDRDWMLAFVLLYILCPVGLLITWLTERRRTPAPAVVVA
ncbi:hypothetical protein GCM10028815_04310 [Mariniluteicoccus flavus]